jgi:hypothetical protein
MYDHDVCFSEGDFLQASIIKASITKASIIKASIIMAEIGRQKGGEGPAWTESYFMWM